MFSKNYTGHILTRDSYNNYILFEFSKGLVYDSQEITAKTFKEAEKKSHQILGTDELDIKVDRGLELRDYVYQILDTGRLDTENDGMIEEEREGWESLAEYYADPCHV